MMTSVTKQHPSTPVQAAELAAAVDQQLDTVLFKAMADPTRVRLLACLIKCGRACSVSEVAACCSVDFSVVARHLAVLAGAGVVDSDKRGRTVWYRARNAELASMFRALADAIDEWRPRGCCADADGAPCCGPSRDGADAEP